ncbi:glycoside hydrolase family protein [Bradyrhizobium sp. STM 3561]|uniref:glycoside hydrolase family protein n=1 Tax=Bradyrhizobium sp. STM 3561 TaxID=578923 RepID=UPI00388D16F0
MTVKKTAITVASAAALAMVLPAVKKSEGYWPTVKVDTIGTGRPCTGGYGETEGVKCGETHDEKFWSDRLAMRLREYDARIGECIKVDVPDSVRAAMITTSYNAGTAAVCRSPMVAKINAGDFRGACAALLTSKIIDGKLVYTGWYIRAQGKVVKGLINRRRDDQRMCFSGVDQKPKASSEETIKAAADALPAKSKADLKGETPPAKSPALPMPKPITKAEFDVDPYFCFGAGRYQAMSEGKQCPVVADVPRWHKWIFK